jgi:autotransporter-associated beta strand protein
MTAIHNPLLPLLIASSMAASPAMAELVTLLQSDASGTFSFTAAGNWSNAEAPSAGNDYSVTGIEEPAETFTLRAPTNATFAGDSLTINNRGVLAWAASANNGTLTTGNLILNGGSISNFRTGGTLTLEGTISVTAASNLRLGSGANTSTRNITLNSTVTGSSPLAMLAQNNSPSTLAVNGDNSSFSGGFLLTGNDPANVSSTLAVGHANALGTGTTTVEQGILNLNGFSVTLGGLAGANASDNFVQNNSDTATTLTINSSGDTSYAGVIRNGSGTGTLSLTKSGAGTFTLTGTNTYTGDTIVSVGTLDLGSTGSITNSTSLNVAAGAVLDVSAQAGFVMTSTQPVTFGLDAAGSGTSGTIQAQVLDITDASVALDVAGPLDDPAYVLATYTSLTGTAFATEPTIPSGYALQYAYQGNKIALVQTGEGTPYENWAGGNLFDEDANDDGVSNGLAFLLGAAGPMENALDLLPASSQDNGALVLTFLYRNAATRGDATLALEHSSDLGLADAWVSVPVPAENDGPIQGVTFEITAGDPFDTVTATIASTETATGKLFARLSATGN